LIFLFPSDTYYDLSYKVYKGFEWTAKFAFDYMVKTDDDIFVRMDTIARELEELGSDKRYYLIGLVYW
jgi:hypothetical protein